METVSEYRKKILLPYETGLNKASVETQVWDPNKRQFTNKKEVQNATIAPLPSPLIKPIDDKESFIVNQHKKNESVIQNAKQKGIIIDPYNQKQVDYWGTRLQAYDESKPKDYKEWLDFYQYLDKNKIAGDTRTNLMNPKTAEFNIFQAWKDKAPLTGFATIPNTDQPNFKQTIANRQTAVDKYQFTTTTQPWKYVPPPPVGVAHITLESKLLNPMTGEPLIKVDTSKILTPLPGAPEPSPLITAYKPFTGDTRDLFNSENLKQFHAAIATTTGWNKKVLEETAQKIKGFENVRETTFEELVGELKLHVQENDALPGVSAADKEANRNELLNTFNTNYAAREEVIGSFVKLLDQKKGVYDWADPVFADAWGKAYTWQNTSAVDILYNKNLAAEDNPHPTNLDEIARALTYLPGSQDDPTTIKIMMTEIPGITEVRAKKIAGRIDHIAYLEAVKSSESANDRAERKQRIKNQEAIAVAAQKLNPGNKTLQGFSSYYKMIVGRGDHLMAEVFADPNADWTEALIQKYEQALLYQNMDEREIEQVAWTEWNSKRR